MTLHWRKESALRWHLLIGTLGILIAGLMSYYSSALFNTPNDSEFFLKKSHLGILTIAQFTLMAIIMLLVWHFSPAKISRHYVRNLLIIGVLARLMLIGVDPYMSNDVDRYMFDGRIAVEGLDPYRVSHDDDALIDLRAQWKPPSEHVRYPTLYPPLAIGLFAFSASAGIDYAHTLWRGLVTLASILVLLLGVLILKKADKLQHLALIALSPILILESGIGLHLDIFPTLAIVAIILAWQHQKIFICGLLIGLGTLIKILPIMLLLPLFFIQPTLRRAFTIACSALTTVVLGYGFMLYLGFKPIGSLGVFFEKWRFASPIFTLFDDKVSGTTLLLLCVLIAVIACSLIAIISFFSKFYRSNISDNSLLSSNTSHNNPLIVKCMQFSVALPLLISPVVFPWYLLPLIPLLALQPNIYLLAWTLIMPLTYEVLGGFVCCQVWLPALWPVWLLIMLYGMTLIMLIKNAFTKIISPKEAI